MIILSNSNNSVLIWKIFIMILLIRNLIIQFSHDFEEWIIYENMKHSVGSSFDDEQRACKFLTLVALFSNGRLDAAGSCTNLYLYKKRSRALMGIIKKLPISGNRLAFCRLPGLAEKKKDSFSLDRLKSLARLFSFSRTIAKHTSLVNLSLRR